jgi:hypothetical protein
VQIEIVPAGIISVGRYVENAMTHEHPSHPLVVEHGLLSEPQQRNGPSGAGAPQAPDQMSTDRLPVTARTPAYGQHGNSTGKPTTVPA